MKSLFCIALFLLGAPLCAQGTQPLTVTDLMKFRHIKQPAISPDGRWIGYLSQPDRGDGEAVLRASAASDTYKVAHGTKLYLTMGPWAAVEVGPDALFRETAKPDELEARRNDLVLLNLTDGTRTTFEKIVEAAFSKDGQWLAVLHAPPEQTDEAGAEKDTPSKPKKDTKAKKRKEEVPRGGTLMLQKLASGHRIVLEDVTAFALSEEGGMVAYARGTADGAANGLFARRLSGDHSAEIVLAQAAASTFPQIAWNVQGSACAWLEGTREEAVAPDRRVHRLRLWDAKRAQVRDARAVDAADHIPLFQKLTWSRDGARLFFGTRPRPEAPPEANPPTQTDDLYDVARLQAAAGLDVWHAEDDFIKPQARKSWEKRDGDHTFAQVWWVDGDKTVALADASMPFVLLGEQDTYLLGAADLPYRKALTWDGAYADYYAVHLKTGKRTLVAEHLPFEDALEDIDGITLSPGSRYVAYYRDQRIHLYALRGGKTQVLGDDTGIGFGNEDHDYPNPPPGYGFAGWTADDEAVLVYDKYDVWQFALPSGKASMLTGGDGRERRVQYRVVKLDDKKLFFKPGEKVLLSAFYEENKQHGFYRAEIGAGYVDKRMEDRKKYHILAKAEQADVLLYTREDFREFPDLWAADSALNLPKRLSNENPQLADFALGEPRLIDWQSADGVPHQGVLYLPGNYREGMRYPMLVYFYRIFSDRMYAFNEMTVNHRPNFPYYTSNGYAVFLPDVHFTVGTPGMSAVKSLVPGVQKVIDMGIADPDAVGLHGHSWSGYQTAYVITQTNLFKAAVAGAPVSNMTSAYSGIRLGTGLARQFQYENGQSRIGEHMWARRDLYIENSPVFFADRIHTPLLIEFGDKDEAVPWQQGIELYLAMRRLDKEVVFLQYHDEPHHLKKYPNKLDYTLKMKAFFDHYLKGEPAPAWLAEGVPYRGD